MSAAETLVRLAARSLPALVRARYREEWLADLAGSDEAGVSRSAVVLGALATAVTIDRLDPATSGLALSRAFVLRLRAATGFGLAATVLTVGSDASGGPAGLGAIAGILAALAIGLAAVGAGFAVGAVRAALAARRVVPAVLVVVGALALAALVASRAGLMLAVLGAVPGFAGLVAAAVLLTQGSVASRRLRVAAALAVPLAALGIATLGLVHVFVWNPLAKLPGLTLDEIYARLAVTRELPVGGVGAWVVVIAALLVAAAVVYAGFALAPVRRWAALRTRRRLVALGLLLIAGTVGLVGIPGFSMGMGIADAFATSGGDAAGSGAVLTLVGMLAVAGVLVVSCVRVEPGPPVGAPAGS